MLTVTDGTHYNVMALQRAVAFKTAGLEAQRLLQEGYGVDADRILDAMSERKAEWERDGQANG